jgi:hypothetical protein
MARKTEITISIATMFVGGMIYVLWRPDTLIMFSWFKTLGLQNSVEELRRVASPYASIFPSWVIYALPQALWFFSGLVAFHSIWATRSKKIYWIYFSGFVSIAFTTEFGQLLNVVPGHFDVSDVLWLLIAGILALIITFPTIQKGVLRNDTR